MKQFTKRFLALMLCAALVLGLVIVPQSTVQAAGQEAIAPQGDKVVYVNSLETTYVPAGYTYVYEGADGQVYTRTAAQNMYISGRVLTNAEAASLAALTESSESAYMTNVDGQQLLCQEFDAAEAAELSQAVREILGDASVQNGEKIAVISEPYTSETSVRVLITFEDEPVIHQSGMVVALGTPMGEAELNASKVIEQEQVSLMARVEKAVGYEVDVHNQFSILTNAVAANVNYGDMAAISKLPGVKSVSLMPTYTVPEINAQSSDQVTLEPNLAYAGPGMGANEAWDVGYKGEGMVVALLDTGLCYENSSFTQEPVDQENLAFTKADIEAILANNDLNAETLDPNTSVDTVYYSSKVPFGFNYGDNIADFGTDDNTWMGHGTHVAGIVAGNLVPEAQEQFEMTSMGIAPEAQLVIMKVFDMNQQCYFDYLVAAMEDVAILGVDAANLSLGSTSGPVYYDGVTEVYDAAYEAGINVVVSAGNETSTGLGSYWGEGMVQADSVSSGVVGMPGSFDSVLTVASAENAAVFNLYGESAVMWYNESLAMDQMVSVTELPNVPEGKGFFEQLKGSRYPFALSLEDAEGALLFLYCEAGNADELVAAAAEAGAAGLVLCPHMIDSTMWIIEEVEVTNFALPVAVSNDYEANWLQQQGMKVGDEILVPDNWNPAVNAGKMSDFSSWGPTEGLTLKPEITGIGGNVFSSYYGDNFAIASGTSMSSPAVAASATLIRQYLKENELVAEEDLAYVVNCLLMSTAIPIFDEDNGAYYFVRRQGAGHANVGNAINSGAYITVEGTNKAKLELGDDPERTGVYEMTFSVVNFSDTDKTYTLDVDTLGQVAVAGGYRNGKTTWLATDYAQTLDPDVRSTLENGTITVAAGQTEEVTVTLSLTDAEKAYIEERFSAGSYVEGFIRLLSEDGVSLGVPFLAFYGNWEDAPILESTGVEASLGGAYAFPAADQVYNGMYSSIPVLEAEGVPMLYGTFVLGDTRAPNHQKVHVDKYDYATMWMSYMPYYKEHAGISINSDNIQDTFDLKLALRRNVENIHYTVTNRETGEVLFEQDTGFLQKSYTHDVYAGAELSYEWLYPIIDLGGGYYYYDTTGCLLEENTWVDITAEVYLEGHTEAQDSITYPLYIDSTAPLTAEDYTFAYGVDSWMAENFGDYSKMFRFSSNVSEYWFMDYSHDITLSIYEDGTFGGMSFTSTYAPTETPLRGQAGQGVTSTSMFDSNTVQITIASDYAGNTFAMTLKGGDNLKDYVEPVADKTVINVGETVTVTDLGVKPTDFTVIPEWTVSDPVAAQIVEVNGNTVTIQGLSQGTVEVRCGFDTYGKSVTIQVNDPDFAPMQDKFEDIQGHWAEEEILIATYRGLFNGLSQTRFGPDETLTRGQLVTILHRLDGESEAMMEAPFTDVDPDAYYADAIDWAYSWGIVEGISEELFAPDEAITREAVVTILQRYAMSKGINAYVWGPTLNAWEDAALVDNWAVDAFLWATTAGIVKGVSPTMLDPDGTTTRAQAAVLLLRMQGYILNNTANSVG